MVSDDPLPRIRQAARLGRVNLTQHAMRRAVERNCSDADIEHALKHASRVSPDQGDRLRVVPDLEGDEMEMVVKLTERPILVITCGLDPRSNRA